MLTKPKLLCEIQLDRPKVSYIKLFDIAFRLKLKPILLLLIQLDPPPTKPGLSTIPNLAFALMFILVSLNKS